MSSRTVAEYSVTIESAHNIPLSSRLLYIQWKRGSKLSGQSRRSLLQDGCCTFNENLCFKCTLIPQRHSQPLKYRKKILEISLYEDLGGRGSKAIGLVTLNLADFVNTTKRTSSFPLTKCRCPGSSIKLTITPPSLSSSSPVDDTSALDTSLTVGETVDEGSEITDAFTSEANEPDHHQEDQEEPKYEEKRKCENDQKDQSDQPKPAKPLNIAITSESSIPPPQPQAQIPKSPRPKPSARRSRTRHRHQTSLLITSPSNWGVVEPSTPKQGALDSPLDVSRIATSPGITNPKVNEIPLDSPPETSLTIPGDSDGDLKQKFEEKSNELESAQQMIQHLERSEEIRRLLDLITSSDFEMIDNQPVSAVIMLKSFISWNIFSNSSTNINCEDPSNKLLIKSIESLVRMVSLLSQFTSSVPTPSLKKRQSLSFGLIYGSEVEGLVYWIRAASFVGSVCKRLAEDQNVEEGQNDLDLGQLLSGLSETSQGSYELTLKLKDLRCTFISELSQNKTDDLCHSHCASCKAWTRDSDGGILSLKSALSLFSHLNFGLGYKCLREVLRWSSSVLSKIVTKDLIQSINSHCVSRKPSPPTPLPRGASAKPRTPILADLEDFVKRLLHLCNSFGLSVSLIQFLFKKVLANLDGRIFNIIINEPGFATTDTAFQLKFIVNMVRSFMLQSSCLKEIYAQVLCLIDEVCCILMVDVELLLDSEERLGICPSLNLLQIDTLLSIFVPNKDQGREYARKVKNVQRFINSLIPQSYSTFDELDLEINLENTILVKENDMVTFPINFDWYELDSHF
ncbi:hypothetical protein P9112_007810 [Eukaryota sp. TZLM1-RC]